LPDKTFIYNLTEIFIPAGVSRAEEVTAQIEG